MQDASADFDAAVAAHRTWVPPRLRTDWNGTGYSGDGTIDDLSGQMGDTWGVDHTFDDGYPETVAFVSGTSVPELSTELTGRNVSGVWTSAPAYWSPLRTDSPVYGYDRDIPPITLDVGLVTAAGQERVRVFTGQMVNTPVRAGKVDLQTISATRLKLMKLVLSPSFSSLYSMGIYATWPISFNMVQCGLFAGPQVRAETAWYVPMHGSAWPMIPSGNQVFTAAELLTGRGFSSWNGYKQTPADPASVRIEEVDWITGPYVSAPDLQLTADLRRAIYTQEIKLESSAPTAMTQGGNRGRLEMWVRGDATDVNHAPGGSGTVSRLCSFWMEATGTGNPYVRMGITPTRHVEVSVWDGANTRTLTSAGTLATDGEWYFIGAAYDMTADKLWVNLNGTVASSSASMVVTNLPVSAETFNDQYPVFLSVLPVSEITFTTGAEANVDSYPLWRSDASFAPNAGLHPSTIKLNAVVQAEPREAWQTIGEYAQGELATVRLTELDVFEYRPLGWWVRDEQQVVTDLITTDRNADAFDIDLDSTKIRNSIKVTYTQLRTNEFDPLFPSVDVPIFEYSPSGLPISLPTGVTVIRFPYSGIGVLPNQDVFVMNGDEAEVEIVNPYITLNSASDGTGTYADSSGITLTFDAWDSVSATIRFVNPTTLTWYIVNDRNVPALRLYGVPIEETSAYVTDLDVTSVAARGERSLEVSAPALQTEESARRFARNLKMNLRTAVPTIGTDQQGVQVLANPLRQPGDLGVFRDDITGVTGGLWRLRGVHHRGNGADYTQAIVARQVYPIMIIGEGLVGRSLIGPSQD